RAEVRDLSLRREHEAGAFAVLGARRDEFFERSQACLEARQGVLARPDVALAPLAFDPGAAERRVESDAFVAERAERRVRRLELYGDVLLFRKHTLTLDVEVVHLDGEARQVLRDALARLGGPLDRAAERARLRQAG